MRGVYYVPFHEQTIAAASGDYDLFEVDPAADKPIEIMAVFLGNKSEVGDAQEEMVSYQIIRYSGGTFTSGNGTAATEVPADPNDVAASFAAKTVGATVATSTGTAEILWADTFNIRTGLQLILPPDMRPKCRGDANSAIVVRLMTALNDDATMSGTLTVAEI
jgi:hypothetical protein